MKGIFFNLVFRRKKEVEVLPPTLEEKLTPQMPVILYDIRRAGNTTRMVDFFIQVLFTKGEVSIYDHCIEDAYEGREKISERISNKMARRNFNIVMRRLEMEHPHVRVVVSPMNYTIVLCDPEKVTLI